MRSRRLGVFIVVGCFMMGQLAGAEMTAAQRASALLQQLHSPDPLRRREAVAALEELDPSQAGPPLRAALEDRDTEVRRRAAAALGHHRIAAARDPLIARLTDGESVVRVEAVEALGALGDEAALAALTHAMTDPDHGVRESAVAAVARLPAGTSSDVVLGLLGRLDDETAGVRRAAMEALAQRGDGRAVLPLLGRLADPSQEVRAAALEALGDLGDARAVPGILRMLADNSDEVRASALGALGRLHAREATAALAELAVRRGEPLRERVLLALGAIAREGDAAAVDVLMAAATGHEVGGAAREALRLAGSAALPRLLVELPRRSPGEAAWMVDLLAGLGDERAAPALLRELETLRLPRERIIAALAAVKARVAVPVLLLELTAAEPERRRPAAAALATLADGRAGDALLAATRDPDAEVRLHAVRAVLRLHPPGAAPRLMSLLGDGDREVRIAAAEALGRAGDRHVQVGLLPLLGSSDKRLRRAAAASLGRLAEPADFPSLVAAVAATSGDARHDAFTAVADALRRRPSAIVRPLLLEDADASPDRAESALAALVAIRDPASAPLLARRLRSPDVPSDIRRLAAQALADLGGGQAREALLNALRGPDAAVRAEAAWGLGKLGGRGVSEVLVDLGRSADAAVRVNAVAALARLGRPFADALSDRDPYVRANAALSADGRSAARLERLSRSDGHAVVRAAALRSLAHLGSAPHAARLAARDPAPEVARLTSLAGQPAAVHPGDAWQRLYVVDGDGNPIAHHALRLVFADGLVKAAVSDGRGMVVEESAPPGACSAELDDAVGPSLW